MKVVLLFILCAGFCFAEDANDLLIKARIYWEAGDFARAGALLQKGEEAAKTDWEKQYFLYNRTLSDLSLTLQISPIKFSFPP